LASGWLARFPPEEGKTAAKLIDEILLISRDELNRGIRWLLDDIMDRRLNPSRPIALYAEREVAASNGKPDPFFPGTETGTAIGAGIPPVVADPKSQEIGSEGPIANLITNYCRLHRGAALSHPGPDEMRAQKIGPIVIVTDFVGSGKRVRDMLDAFARVATIQSWRSYGYISFHVVAYSGTTTGIEHIQSSRLKPHVMTVSGCPRISDVFRGSELTEIISLCNNYPGKQKRPLGFRDTGALIAFAHGIPNNAPLLLHSTRNGWQPLFRNRSTLGADYEFPVDNAEVLAVRAARMLRIKAARNGLTNPTSARWIKTMLVLAAVEKGCVSAQRVSAMSRVPIREVEEILGFTLIARWTSERGRLTALGREELLRLRRRRSRSPMLPSGTIPFYYPTQLRAR
jgi:hypothetical protein